MPTHANLELEGKKIDLPVVIGSENEKAIDISKLRNETGLITLDPGYVNTGSCTSQITFIDGEKGILRYRGIPIEELAEESDFLEVAYLLIYGNLPSSSQINHFKEKVFSQSEFHSTCKNILNAHPRDAHPMGILTTLMSSLASVYPQYTKQELSPEEKSECMTLLLGVMKSFLAALYRHKHELPYKNTQSCNYAGDFLELMFDDPSKQNETISKALDTLLILHADHEQNCSTSSVRLVGSSKTNIFAAMAAGCAALWGPSHGGANQDVIEMLTQIHHDGGGSKKFIEKAKDKNSSFRLSGFGHRVYKNFDPRAKIIKKACDQVLEQLGIHDPLLDLAKSLETQALEDSYFQERKLFPNVDFYSGIILKSLGIPIGMFTPIFAFGRLPGWMANWKEMVETSLKLCRPRQIYTGPSLSSFTPLKER